jgi:hypothetical protein
MIPIFLWSVVVTQSTQRLVLRGLAISSVVICGTGRSSVAVAVI